MKKKINKDDDLKFLKSEVDKSKLLLEISREIATLKDFK